MFLKQVEEKKGGGKYGLIKRVLTFMGKEVPGIFHLFGFRPNATKHLARFTHEVMRGPSELPAHIRELIAAFVSARNQCVF